MYQEYFGLKEAPFSIAPDPQFLYMSDRHREALAHLVYGLKTAGGFVLLTGEVGTGKTTVCRCLLEQLPENSEIAFLFNPKLTVLELLATICDELRIAYPPGSSSIKVFIDALNCFLLAAHAQGRKTVLIIDEAQNLSAAVLEQIRLLTNLETNKQKLLQVIMLGQPELRLMLERPELRQLAQRISARYHLEPLAKNELRAYVDHRLAVAGLNRSLFPAPTIRNLYRLSGGVPRLINLLCDRALLGAYVRDRQSVGPGLLDQAAREVFGKPPLPRRLAARSWRLLLGLVLLIGAGILAVSTSGLRQPAPEPVRVEAAPVAPAQPAVLEWDRQRPISHSRELAYQSLFTRWGKSYQPELGTVSAQAAGTGLGLLSQRGSLDRLRQLNRPAVLKLKNPQEQEYYATLVALSAATADLVVGEQRRTVSLQTLAEQWFGEFALLWQPPAEFQGVLKPGDRGGPVQWLDQQLAIVNGRSARSGAAGVFDGQLLKEVQAFQAAAGLVPDGVVGAYTLIQLNSRTSQAQPTLTDRPKD